MQVHVQPTPYTVGAPSPYASGPAPYGTSPGPLGSPYSQSIGMTSPHHGQYNNQPYSSNNQQQYDEHANRGGSYASATPGLYASAPPPQQLLSSEHVRPMVGPVEGVVPGVSRLLFHGQASSRVGCMHTVRGCLQPWTCACVPSVSQELAKGRYVQVYDNKVEINEPDSCMYGCGLCVVRDRVTTVHFDRALVQNASKAESCAPSCSHGDCCPSCFNLYGETLVLHSDPAPCCALCNCCTTVATSSSTQCSNSGCCISVGDWAAVPLWSWLPCFPQHKLVFGLDNVAELAQKINAARTLRGGPRAQPPF